MPMYDLTCSNEHIHRNLLLPIGSRPPCPDCGEPTEMLWDKANSVVADGIPGGLWIEHGLCNADGSPKRYDYKSDIARDAKAKGLHWGAFLNGSPAGRTWV